MKNPLQVTLCVIALFLGDASMTEAMARVPLASTTLRVSAGMPVEQVLACAEQELSQLGARDDLWNHEVTVRDIPAGRLETGRFEDHNITGFRIRLHHLEKTGAVDIELKGAGAYLVDLGVEEAMREFTHGLERCLASSP